MKYNAVRRRRCVSYDEMNIHTRIAWISSEMDSEMCADWMSRALDRGKKAPTIKTGINE